MDSRQRDLLAQARQARLVHEAQQAKRANTLPPAAPGATQPLSRRRWRWQVRLAALLRAG